MVTGCWGQGDAMAGFDIDVVREAQVPLRKKQVPRCASG
jgi:hypothetical protein